MSPQPSVGRIVHYTSYGTPGGEYGIACRAAVVTSVTADVGLARIPAVSLCVLNPDGLFFNKNVRYHEGVPLKPGESRDDLCGDLDYPGGSWHWPAKVLRSGR